MWKNHLLIKPYKNCTELLAKKFFKALDTQDFRYILKCDYLPEYNQNRLNHIWDNIIKEYDDLTGKNIFGYQLMELKHDLSRINRLNGLNAAYQLMLLDEKKALEDLRYWGVNVTKNTYNEQKRILSLILMEQTKINIQNMRKGSFHKDKKDSFFDSLFDMESFLERNLDENMTVVKWVSVVKSTNKKINARKNAGKNKKY